MALLETVTLDGLALNDNTNFQLLKFDPAPAPKNYRWITGEDADGAVLAEKPRRGNRAWEVTVRVMPQATMDAALAKLGQIVDKLEECENHPGGLAGTWTPGADATKSLTFYVYSGEVTGLPINRDSGWWKKRPEITFVLHADPSLHGTEVTSAATVTNSDPVQILIVSGVQGDMPAEARLTVTDAASQNRRHVEWGCQWRHTDLATPLIIDSDSLVTTGFSGLGQTRVGAYDPGASGSNVIRATLGPTPVVICSTGNMAHVGTFHVKARVFSSTALGATAPAIRLSYQEGEGPFQANPWATPQFGSTFVEVDLGVVTIPPATLGTQRWVGRLEAYHPSSATDYIEVDYLVLIPAEQYGKARAELTFEEAFASYLGQDAFDQAAGPLAGKTSTSGHSWSWSGTGDTDDFQVETTGKTAQRTAVSDTSPGRVDYLSGTTGTNMYVETTMKFSARGATGAAAQMGVVARYTTSSSYLRAYLDTDTDTNGRITIEGPAGVGVIAQVDVDTPVVAGIYYTLRLYVDSGGLAAVWFFQGGTRAPRNPTATAAHAALATGGTLASGVGGLYEFWNTSTASTRNYRDLKIATLSRDAVVHAGQSAEIRHDGAIREDATGTYWGLAPSYRGAHFFLPPAGDENRTSRILVKSRRNDIDVAQDDQIADSTTVTLHYQPRWSTVPR